MLHPSVPELARQQQHIVMSRAPVLHQPASYASDLLERISCGIGHDAPEALVVCQQTSMQALVGDVIMHTCSSSPNETASCTSQGA